MACSKCFKNQYIAQIHYKEVNLMISVIDARKIGAGNIAIIVNIAPKCHMNSI